MRFLVRRTSDWHGKKPPCDTAFRTTLTVSSRSPVTSLARSLSDMPPWWRNKGSGHRIEEDESGKWFVREVTIDSPWFVDIDSLEDLMELRTVYGPIILDNYEHGYPVLEIYDDYRE